MNKVKLKVVKQRKGWTVLRVYRNRHTERLTCNHLPTEEEAVEFSRLFASNYEKRGFDVTVHNLSKEAFEAVSQRNFNKTRVGV